MKLTRKTYLTIENNVCFIMVKRNCALICEKYSNHEYNYITSQNIVFTVFKTRRFKEQTWQTAPFQTFFAAPLDVDFGHNFVRKHSNLTCFGLKISKI